MFLLTSDDMRRADRLTIDRFGVSLEALMENAGRRVFEAIESGMTETQKRRIVIIAGKGNNGGDGLVVARLLRERGRDVNVLKVVPAPEAPLASLQEATLIVDAIFGTGLRDEVKSPVREVIEAINRHSGRGVPVISIDVPTGLSSDTGCPLGAAVKATLTVTLGAPKIGLIQPEALPYTGRLVIADIGIPEAVYAALNVTTHWVTSAMVAPWFEPRRPEAHKGSCGHVLLFGGSENKPGAVLLSGRAALRTGSGRVTVALPDKAFRKFPKNFLELMYEPVASTRKGLMAGLSSGAIRRLSLGKNAIAAGPGLGVSAETRRLILSLMRERQGPLVIDADGLNALAAEKKFPKVSGSVVLTPHPAEMARLLRSSAREVNRDRMLCASGYAIRHGVIVVLKGFRTVTAFPDGRVFVNSSGNPAMATAGMGDVLTGVIASLMGQGLSSENAAVAGVYLHGRAGDRVAGRLGGRGLLASDVIEEMPQTIQEVVDFQE